MLIPSGFAQANIQFTGAGVPHGAEVTIGLDHTGTGMTPTQVAQAVDNAYFDAGIPLLLADNVDETSILVKFGPNSTGPSVIEATNNPSSGPGQAAPQLAWLVRKVTALGGRAGRGRLYWPGLPEAAVGETGIIVSASVVAMQTAMDTFLSELQGAGLPPVVLHAEGSPLSTPTPITDFVVQSLCATQRRRVRP